MPLYNGFLPREGFRADTVLKIIRNTALNPKLLLPLLLLVKYTKKGQDWAILHPKAYSCLKNLLAFGLLRWINSYFSRGVLNNWVDDKYDWSKEIVVVTGGAGGIGGQVVQLLAERGIKVVVLDIQPLTYPAGIKRRTPREIQHTSPFLLLTNRFDQVPLFIISNVTLHPPRLLRLLQERFALPWASQLFLSTMLASFRGAPSLTPASVTFASPSTSTRLPVSRWTVFDRFNVC